jgi:hypothetical protein
MTSKKERFWIQFILRLGFGFLFLFVAVAQFDAGGPNDDGPSTFAAQLSGPFAESWLGQIVPDIKYTTTVEERGGTKEVVVERDPSYYFLLALPYTFAVLSVPILTGLFLRPALRLGAVLLVLLGLGKYITGGGDVGPTVDNFVLAGLICGGLWFLRRDPPEASTASAAHGAP